MKHPRQVTEPQKLWETMFGHGQTTLSIVSKRTGTRKTFRVKRVPGKDGKPDPLKWWVSQLTGPDNRLSFTYLLMADGEAGRDGYIELKLKGKTPDAGWEHAAVKAFLWLFQVADGQKPGMERVEVWLACDCTRCGKLLTVPKSISYMRNGQSLPRGPYCQTQP